MAMTLQWIGICILITTFALTLIRLVPHNGWIELSWDGIGYLFLLGGNLIEGTTLGYAFAALWFVMLCAWGWRVYRAYCLWQATKLFADFIDSLRTAHLAAGGTEATFGQSIADKEFKFKDGEMVEVPPEERDEQ